jgi:hypothetical protein
VSVTTARKKVTVSEPPGGFSVAGAGSGEWIVPTLLLLLPSLNLLNDGYDFRP